MLEEFGGPLQRIRAAAPLASASVAGSSNVAATGILSLFFWNLLAPPYNRKNEDEQEWLRRMRLQMQEAKAANADIMAFQEFWCASEQYCSLWRQFAEQHGYTMHVTPRVDSKRDGCAMLVKGCCEAHFSAFTFADWGSRIVQSTELRFGDRFITLLHTHLTFPHASDHDPPMRLQQGCKLAEHVQALGAGAAVCCFGDFNGDFTDPAVALLCRSGELQPPPPCAGGEPEPWVSHVAHTGSLMACDHALTKNCEVRGWRLGGSREALISGALPSDHRWVHAELALEPGGRAVRSALGQRPEGGA